MPVATPFQLMLIISPFLKISKWGWVINELCFFPIPYYPLLEFVVVGIYCCTQAL